MKKRYVLLSFVLFLCTHRLLADDDPHHFNSRDKLGTVSFSTSCRRSVKEAFNRGVALLHSFEYDAADQQFQEVAKLDPGCAIAYWGQAMTLYRQLWGRPGQVRSKRGWELLQKAKAVGAKTQRERDYIDALAVFYSDYDTADYETRAAAYPKAMETLYRRYPHDHEAGAFYALALLSWADSVEKFLANSKKAISILTGLFAQEPNHPGIAHYLIHACDHPQFAQMGLVAARRYAQIAPSSPHALHMPSHIFARLGLWEEDIQSNLAAIAAAKKQSPKNHDSHAMEFLEYAYLQVGEEAKAKALIDELEAIPKNDVEEGSLNSYNLRLATFPALYVLEMRRWNDALSLQPPAGVDPYIQGVTYWARAVAAGHLHNTAAAQAAIEQYDALTDAADESEEPYWAGYMRRKLRDEAAAWLAFAEGKNDEAVDLLRPIADTQDLIGKEEVEFPAREMLAEILLEANRPQEALAEYEKSLRTDANRFNGLYGAARAAEAAHLPEKAKSYYAQLLKTCENGAYSDRPEIARARLLAGK